MGILATVSLLAGLIQAEAPKRTPLQEALERARKPDGKLSRELFKLSDYEVRRRDDALAICATLAALKPDALPPKGRTEPIEPLARLFLSVPDAQAPAFDILRAKGLPELARLYDALKHTATKNEGNDLVLVLRVMILFGAPDAEDRVVDAGQRRPLAESWHWETVLSIYAEVPPKVRRALYARLRENPPLAFAGVAFLDVANDAALAGRLKEHYFDSPGGAKRLAEYFGGQDPERYSYAVSAARALPFLNPAYRGPLLALASGHVDPRVKLQAAWARVKTGDERGVKTLAAACLNDAQSKIAQELLTDLDRGKDIPKEVFEGDFAAKAEFAEWLSHPSELGRPPDRLDVLDSRELVWPGGEDKKIACRLIRYTAKEKDGGEDVGVGIVGPTTWCSFDEEYPYYHIEDLYGSYAAWSMEQDKLSEDVEIPTDQDVNDLVAAWRGPRLDKVRFLEVRRVRFPKTPAPVLVALAEAFRDGQEGWAILDREWSSFYPKTLFPADFYHADVLSAHVGRRALGFPRPDATRPRWLKEEPPKKKADPDPAAVVRDFGTLLADVKAGKVSADDFGEFGRAVDRYAAALKALNRGEEMKPVLKDLEEIWRDHWYVKHSLGEAARLAGLDDLALPLLEAYFPTDKNQGRGDDASHLAGLLVKAGRREDARKVLRVALKAAVDNIRESKYMADRWTFEREYQGFRSTFAKIFGEAALAKEGLPETLLPPPFTLPER